MTVDSIGEWQLDLPDELATQALGIRLGRLLPPSSVVLLNGELGSGKTTLVQGMGLGLGITDPIVSPTFTLICEYAEGRIPLYHLDLYRLNPEEIEPLHLDGYWEGTDYPPGIMAIEWAERLLYLPPAFLSLQLKALGSGRQVGFQATGASHQQLLAQLRAGYES
jgi:tRNA threonylcarbamoyladenosine biosynthesis protein TsaE